jgi:hypothetical protein
MSAFHEGTIDEVGAIVGDDTVREAVVVDELVDELFFERVKQWERVPLQIL